MFDNDEIKSKEEILSIVISEKFKAIFTNNNIHNVIIFGSLSKDDFNEESDIDIAVISNEKINFSQELKIVQKLEDILGREIDFIDINDENINNMIKIEALNSKLIIISDEKLEETIEFYDRLYKENKEFWYFLDRSVLGI